jgi:hypothetical protein
MITVSNSEISQILYVLIEMNRQKNDVLKDNSLGNILPIEMRVVLTINFYSVKENIRIILQGLV